MKGMSSIFERIGEQLGFANGILCHGCLSFCGHKSLFSPKRSCENRNHQCDCFCNGVGGITANNQQNRRISGDLAQYTNFRMAVWVGKRRDRRPARNQSSQKAIPASGLWQRLEETLAPARRTSNFGVPDENDQIGRPAAASESARSFQPVRSAGKPRCECENLRIGRCQIIVTGGGRRRRPCSYGIH